MKKAERYSFLIEYFSNNMPQAETELTYDNPFQLLVAVILSAQCTDKRVNSITPNIFKQFPDAKTMSEATFEDIFSIIRSISYPNNKARHLIAMSKLIINDFGGEVPMSVEKLVLLPGVGRKTANVITSVIDNQPNMAVDTHVFRVSTRIGLITNAKTPLAVEKQLVKNLPKELIHRAHHWLILHGRYTCTARNPKCVECGIKNVCKFSKKTENC